MVAVKGLGRLSQAFFRRLLRWTGDPSCGVKWVGRELALDGPEGHQTWFSSPPLPTALSHLLRQETSPASPPSVPLAHVRPPRNRTAVLVFQVRISAFLKKILFYILEGKGGREKERERNIHVG